MKVWIERLVLGVNVVALALVGWLLLRPEGPLGRSMAESRVNSGIRRTLQHEWPALIRAPRLDSGTAEVRFVEFSDYGCSFCREQHQTLRRLAGRIGVAYRHFPSPGHPRARDASLAAICADRQGRFLAMHARLFETDGWQANGDWRREAAAAGIPDVPQFLACVRSVEASARLEEDVEYGRRLGVQGTPSFLSRRGRIVGVQTDSALLRSAGGS